MKRIITLSIISFLALSFYTGRTQTVVFSSGFETWTSSAPIIPTDWFGAKTSFAANGDSTTQYTSTPHSGTYAIKLQSRTSSHKRLTTHAVPITAGTAYYITFWVRGHGSIRTGLYKGGSALTDYVYNSYIAVNTTTWTQESQAITADTTSAVSTFILSAKLTVADLEDLQVDDVTITTEPIRTVSIYNIQYTTASPANSPLNDSIVTTSGVVSARFNKGFFIQDAYGPWNGVYVYDSAHAAALSLAQGDSVTLTGGVQEYYNYTEISNLASLTRISASNPVHAAYPVTGATSGDESLEGILVQISDVPCVKLPNTYGEWVVFDTDSSYIGKLLYAYTPVLSTSYNITGVVYNNGGPNVIEPRNVNDIAVATGINELNKNSVSIYPNPVSNNIIISNMTDVNVIKIFNVLGETIQKLNISGSAAYINVSNLSKGIYFISLMNEKGIIETKKFVKE